MRCFAFFPVVAMFLTTCLFADPPETSVPKTASSLSRYEFERPKMGMAVRILLYTETADQAENAAEAAYRRFDEINASMSDYDPESEVVRLAQAADREHDAGAEPSWHAVSPDLHAVLLRSRRFSELSGGAFDITLAPLTKLWRRARRQRAFPEKHLLDRALARVGYETLEIDPDVPRVRLLKKGMRLDLGGIAKGYAIDAAFDALAEHGIDRVLIDAGGDMRLGEPPPEDATGPDEPSSWTVAIAPLEAYGRPVVTLPMSNTALAVSGDFYRFVEIDGVRYSHLLNPKTGIGLTELLTVAVTAPDATSADALASAVSVLGIDKGLALIETLPETAALVVRRPRKDGEPLEIRMSSRWNRGRQGRRADGFR